MLSNVLTAGKDIANKITNKFLNLSDVEVKIKTATNEDKWGPNGSLMKEIAEETFSTTSFNESMTFLWYRMFTERPQSSRRTYKGLVLLSYLIVNGSDLVAVSCRTHISDIVKLKSYNDPNGVADLSIRRKACDICDLLNDPERLSNERKRAKSYQNRSARSDTVTGVTSFDSKTYNGQSLGDIDDWEPDSKSIPYVIGESFMNFVTTFTQNISGPPPTETHDNFDIPSMDYHVSEARYDDQVRKPKVNASKSHKSSSIESVSSTKVKVESKPAVAPKKSVPEDPIIDFSEPVANNATSQGPAAVFPATTNLLEDDIDEEFGNLRSHEDFHSVLTANRSGMKTLSHEFEVDFEVLNRPTPANISASVSVPSAPPTANVTPLHQREQKPPPKIGSTWNELDSLNIDLNNLCSRKHVYNKS